MRPQRRQRAVERPDRRGHQRLCGQEARIRHEIARCEIIRSIRDHVVARDQVERVRGGEPRLVRLDAHMRIEPRDLSRGAFDLAVRRYRASRE